jgi:hypothetical protein
MITTTTIIGRTVNGTASGNYDGSSQDFISDAVQAANYYRGRGGLQTVTFDVAGFEGVMHLEATLDHAPETAVWFNTFDYGDGSTAPLTDRYPETVIGNFTWMRVRVTEFSAGTINFVNISY